MCLLLSGVHAFKQIVSLYVRSALNDATDQIGFLPPHINPLNTDLNTYVHSNNDVESSDSMYIDFSHSTHRHQTNPRTSTGEFDYARMLNKSLPDDIRIIQWKPVDHSFHARFQCNSRTYKYIFYRDSINTSLMNTTAQKFIGAHDFRNFCKPDPTSVVHFNRLVQNINVYDQHINTPSTQHCDDRCMIQIRGNAFLYHQIRCMTSVLFNASRQPPIDQPDLVEYLLDIDRCPNKPIYDLTSEQPLILWNCEYDDTNLFTIDHTSTTDTINNLKQCYSTFHQQWRQQQIRADVLKQFVDEIENMINNTNSMVGDITQQLRGDQLNTCQFTRTRTYIPFCKRKTEKSNAARIDQLNERDKQRRNDTLQLHHQHQQKIQDKLKLNNPHLL